MVIDGHEVLTDPTELPRLLVDDDDVVGIDLESTGLDPWRDDIATVQLYGDKSGTLALIRTPGGVIPQAVKDVIARPGRTLIAHNGVAFDIPFLHNAGVEVSKADWYDTLVAETAIVPTQRRDVSKSLRASAKRRLGTVINKDIEHSGWANDELTEDQVLYAVSDVLVLPALRRSQLDKAEEFGVTRGLENEMRLVLPVAWLTINGMPLNPDKLSGYLAKQVEDRAHVQVDFEAEFGAMNARSPKQVKDAFISRGVEVLDTKKETLQDLLLLGGKGGELANIILEYRRPDQRLKVYGGDWVARHMKPDGRIHPRFWQCSTDTTRFSSSGPNGEQIPRDMRYVFGWEPGKKVVSVDYSQIEIRVAAKIAGDEVLMALLEDEDVHASIAAEAMFHVPIDQVSPAMRKLAKAVSFTLLFGGGPQKFYEYAHRSGGTLTVDDAYGVVRNFFEKFKGLADMRARAIGVADQGRPVTIRIPHGLKRMLVGRNIRPTVILNTMVQASAASGIKYGILEAWDRGLVVGKLCNQVHDELVAVVDADEATEYAAELKDAMLVGFRRAVDCNPKVEVKVNDFWEE